MIWRRLEIGLIVIFFASVAYGCYIATTRPFTALTSEEISRVYQYQQLSDRMELVKERAELLCKETNGQPPMSATECLSLVLRLYR